ncbi:unnamed protein product [Caenorhabditis auriculariae]|uniref:Uncharacterized protein n=1 Tax=Caenorhabditis auriculariae TaxID=2777116 RepID=A0A8S1GXK2_9PELO|nr:unnamed protein product [Caenorhabditis auriculariae]
MFGKRNDEQLEAQKKKQMDIQPPEPQPQPQRNLEKIRERQMPIMYQPQSSDGRVRSDSMSSDASFSTDRRQSFNLVDSLEPSLYHPRSTAVQLASDDFTWSM